MSEQTEDIKRCPFCGSTGAPSLVSVFMGGAFHWVDCEENMHGCGSTGPERGTASEAISAWNLATAKD